jgi:glycosyltransferase involved in cell wall biosynthesis
MPPTISVVIPTRNRPEKLQRTIDCLQMQSLPRDEYEVIVVDDGSEPPTACQWAGASNALRILRLAHGERSLARNRGAEAATGRLLAFVDDDMLPGPTFLRVHLDAHQEWPGILAVGAVPLPEAVLRKPFGRFRMDLERGGIPTERGLVPQPNLCTAQNMSLSRNLFFELGGFAPDIVSAEDQDLALRHTRRGGRIAFIPEATAIHDDDNIGIRPYCRRSEWGAENLAPFLRRYPDLPDNRERVSVNGPIRWSHDPLGLLCRKALKAMLAWPPAVEGLFALTSILERLSPSNRGLRVLYTLLLGIHLQRGFRKGWGPNTS